MNGVSCSATTTPVTVYLNDVTSAGAISTTANQTICENGDPIELQSTSIGTGTGTISYQWYSRPVTTPASNFAPITGETGLSYDPPAGLTITTQYRRQAISTLTVGGVGPTECVANTVFRTVTVVPNVSAGTVSGTSPICIGATTTYTSNGTAGGTWSSSNTAVATVDATTGVVTALSAGTTDIKYEVTSGCGSPVNATKSLTVSSNVSAGTVSGSSPICIGATPTYTSNGTAGGTWSSSNTAVATVDATTGVVTALSAGTTDIKYEVTSGCGSPVNATKLLTVNETNTTLSNPSAAIQTVCFNSPINNIVYTIGGSGTGATVSGLPTGVNATYNPSTKELTISGSPSVSGIFSYSVTATGLCTIPTITGSITVKNLPNKPTITATTTTGCTYQNVTFTINCASGFVKRSDGNTSNTYTTTIGTIDYGLTYKCTTNPASAPVCESDAATALPNITPKATPTAFCLTPAYTINMTEPIKTCGSQANIQYSLFYVPTGAAIKTLVGTGVAMNFGPQFFPGQYKIVAKNTKSGCQVEMSNRAYFSPNSTRMGVDESDEASEWVNIGENPVKEVLTVKFNGAVGQKVNIVLSDIQGKIVTNKEVTITQPRHTEEINMQRSATGTYILNVQQNEKIKRFTILKAQ